MDESTGLMNRLKDSISPYLLQHAHNPVDWYPWGEEAFAAAQAQDKPILLSVGYSACHWCHVMAHESFEDPDTAAIMNRDFVCIKVDREERPDIDDIYMQATLIFNRGHGGWPMTVFLTPDGRPFHAGTYYPREDRYGMPSFRKLMAAISDAYRTRREQVEEIAEDITNGLRRDTLEIGGSPDDLNSNLLDEAFNRAIASFDSINGGLTRGRPKFPSPMNLEFLLRHHARTGDARALEIATFTLRRMAMGGIYDQIGGGFHRYSVDERWLVPHFEKMLYDNAQLSRLYLHGWQVTGDPFFRQIAVEIYDYLLREMTAPEGGFYSATDADSEGEEGKFFVWSVEAIKDVLTPDEGRAAIAYWGVTLGGNFEGQNILHVPFEDGDVASNLGITLEALRSLISSAKDKLYAHRTHRVHPNRDEKILTSWNGLALASFAEAARVLEREDYRTAAIRAGEFLLSTMLTPEGRLQRSHKDGKTQFNGCLEDYACLIEGLLELYQTTFETRYFSAAWSLTEMVLKHFSADDGGFFDTSDDHEKLIARPRALQDNATPAGNTLIAKVLLMLSAYTGDLRYESAAVGVLSKLSSAMGQYPLAFGEGLNALSMLVRGLDEVAIIGDAPGLMEVLNSGFRPFTLRAFSPDDVWEKGIPPLLTHRGKVDGQSTAYVCRNLVCQRPVTSPDALREQLDQSTR